MRLDRVIDDRMSLFAADEQAAIRQEAAIVKGQIALLEQRGWRVILFDVPRDTLIATTPREMQLRDLIRDLFPSNQFEWLPEPPSREWMTNDGVHLVAADARAYAQYVEQQLLTTTGQHDPNIVQP